MSLGDRLNDKLGPAPVWVWGAGLGGAILAVQWYRNRSTASTVEDAPSAPGPSPEAAPAASTVADAGEGVSFFASGTYTPVTDGASAAIPPTSDPQPTDNDEWLRLAIIRVSARDASLPVLTIEAALFKYLNGQPLTEQESSIVELAIRTIGPTPYPAPPVTVIPTPVVRPNDPIRQPPRPGGDKPPATPPASADPTYTIKAGDTLWGIVKAHYGSVTTNRVRAVAAYNGLTWSTDGTRVSPFKVGQVLKLPPGV